MHHRDRVKSSAYKRTFTCSLEHHLQDSPVEVARADSSQLPTLHAHVSHNAIKNHAYSIQIHSCSKSMQQPFKSLISVEEAETTIIEEVFINREAPEKAVPEKTEDVIPVTAK